MTSRVRNKIALLAFSSLVAFFMMEFAIRRFLPHYDPRRQILFTTMPEYDDAAIGPPGDTIRVRTPKGDYDLTIPFNARGFRDDLDFRESTATDWFAVGDSFTFGWGIPSGGRFSDQLASLLGIRFFNIAIPGDVVQYAGTVRYARERGATISNAVVGVCMNNDPKNYNTAEKVQPMLYGDRKPWKAHLRAWLQTHSAVYLACSFELQRIPALRRFFERVGIARDINQLTLQNLYDEDVLNSSVERAARLAELINPKSTWLVLIPSLALWVGENQETERRIHDTLAERLRARGLRVIDLKPAFDAEPNPRRYYFETDAHWNLDGQAFAARLIADASRPALASHDTP